MSPFYRSKTGNIWRKKALKNKTLTFLIISTLKLKNTSKTAKNTRKRAPFIVASFQGCHFDVIYEVLRTLTIHFNHCLGLLITDYQIFIHSPGTNDPDSCCRINSQVGVFSILPVGIHQMGRDFYFLTWYFLKSEDAFYFHPKVFHKNTWYFLFWTLPFNFSLGTFKFCLMTIH